ncbi:MAG: AAA family ATPase [Chloroflexota bacterium]|nr:AAA family ATPase [Chloroflexota bacterium]
MRDKFRAMESEMGATWFERRAEVRGLLVGMVARQHVLFLGPPGTGKSAMGEDLCSRVGGHYFRWLMSRTSTPEELFGPISLRALENDSYRRVVTGKLPEADIAFLDEVWKANSAVLNSLLSALNERLFFNDGQPVKMPLQMVIGASNELPEDREELGALWDRFGLRYVVGYVKDPHSFDAMLHGAAPASRTTITMAELAAAQAEAAQVDASPAFPQLATLRQKMAELNVPVSDRRWKQTLDLLRAHAWMEGRTRTADDDLEILAPALWQEPGQIVQVRGAIMAMANPLNQEAQDLLDEAMEVYQTAMAAPEEKAAGAGLEAITKFRRIAKRLEVLKKDAAERGRGDERITEALARTLDWNKEVGKKCLSLSA